MALRILIVLLVLAIPLELPGCGPFLPEQLFHMVARPDQPDQFLRGQLGILQPTFERLYQVIAYRYLIGAGLNDAEQRAVTPAPQLSFMEPAPTAPPNPWVTARNAVPGVQPLKEVDPYRQVKRQGYFDSYLNCNDDAFRMAAATLQRVSSTPAAKDWIAAQDTVFADCSNGAAIPPPATDPQLRADRAYQIASAKFYSEQYDAARGDFQTIAADAASPWRPMAPYLAARCLIRAGKFDAAEKELQRIVADPAMTRWHAPANALLGYVRVRLHPAERMHDLALALVRKDSQATIGQDAIDYRLLWDQNVIADPDDDLTAWIRSYKAGGAGSIDNWRATRALPWLVAALQFSGRNDSALAELLPAAAAIQADSPAYLTVSYQRVRLMPPDEARALADRLLAGNLPAAARNQFRAERMHLAGDFDDFLRYVPRHAVAELTDEVQPVDPKEDSLDKDGAEVLNLALPLAYLQRAAAGAALPNRVRVELQRAIFVRTLLLSDKPPFDQVFTLLKTPGMQLDLEPGAGRYTPEVDKIDPYRDNWWCSPKAPNAPPDANFLTPAERQQAETEATKLRAAAAGPDWLTAQTLAFAEQHPQDPRVPEALYLAVRSTRYGCTDDGTGDLSKRAFDLLHRRYPENEWTRKTPYWFK